MKISKYSLIIILLLLSGAVLLFSGLSSSLLAQSTEGTSGDGRTYSVKPVSLKNTLIFTGEVAAKRSVEIFSPRGRERFGGTISYLPVEGTTVKKGDRLVEFDTSDLLTNQLERQRLLDESKIRLEMTKANLRAQQADLQTNLETQKTNVQVANLYSGISKELLPANQYQRYQLNLDQAKLALQKAEEQMANFIKSREIQIGIAELDVAKANIDLQRLQNDMDSMTIAAPQDGLVIYGDNWMNNRKVQIGDVLFGGQTVVSLPDLSEMQIVCDVYDMEVKQVVPGLPAVVTIDALPGKAWNGSIDSLTSIAVRKSFASKHKVFKATIKLQGGETAIMKPGMTARVEIPVSVRDQVVAIPREFVFVDQRGNYSVRKVTSTAENKITVTPVKTGEATAKMVEILEGLAPGDLVSLN